MFLREFFFWNDGVIILFKLKKKKEGYYLVRRLLKLYFVLGIFFKVLFDIGFLLFKKWLIVNVDLVNIIILVKI